MQSPTSHARGTSATGARSLTYDQHDHVRALIAAGARLEQDGDAEGSLSFDPANVTACALAIKAAGCKRRRVPSDAQRAVIAANLEKMSRERAVRVAKTDDRRAGGLSPSPARPTRRSVPPRPRSTALRRSTPRRR
jgi:hypothetical protein